MAPYGLLVPMRAKSLLMVVVILAASWPLSCRVFPLLPHLKNLRQVDPVLTNLAQGYHQAGLIAESVMPMVPTDKEGVKVPIFGKGSVLSYETERAPGAESNVITIEKSGMLPIVLDEHDLAAPVDYREQAESLFDEQAKATRRVTAGVQLRQEIETAALVQRSSVYASGLTSDLASKSWSDDASDPVVDVKAGKAEVRKACGQEPNVLVLGATVFDRLTLHPAVKAYLSGSERKILTADILRNLFGVDEILVGKAVATPASGKAVEDVWGKFAALIVRPTVIASGNDEGIQSFGYTFRRRGMPMVDRYPGAGGKIEYARYTDIRKPAVVGGTCGYLFKNAIA